LFDLDCRTVITLQIICERSDAYCHIVEPKPGRKSVLPLQMRVRQLAMVEKDDLGCWTGSEESTRPSMRTTWESRGERRILDRHLAFLSRVPTPYSVFSNYHFAAYTRVSRLFIIVPVYGVLKQV